MFMKKYITLFIACFVSHITCLAQTNNILMFVSHEQTYYSEYIVMRAALEAMGYTVDVRSSSTDPTSIYMVPQGGSPATINGVANSLGGSSYTEFTTQFQNSFGVVWDGATYNATPDFINVDGLIQDVTNMSGYDALVVIGGLGALDYRVDGSYNAQGSVSAIALRAAAEKLNELALDALANGKPVMAQCHASSLAAFWRIPATSGPGEEAMGFSVLKDHYSTGFPEAATGPMLTSLNVTHRPEDRVTVSSPHSSFEDNGNGEFKVITTQDWYPQSVAYAARTLLNILETYPSMTNLSLPVSVLILHGGAVDTSNCGAGNRANDIPCNYGNAPADIPADYIDVVNLLEANSPNDAYNFTVTDQNLIGGSLPFDPLDESSIGIYLAQFNVVVFYKHWSTGVTLELENAIVSYADDGGGVVAMHHGLYNDIDGPRNKDIITQMFGAESAQAGWGANRTNFNVFGTNYGHFVSTYGVNLLNTALSTPATWFANPLIPVANASFSSYPVFDVFDEIYTNMTFLPGQIFGRGINEITPLFSNDLAPEGQAHTTGFVKLFNPSGDESVGRLAYFTIGETKANTNVNHLYGQVIRNAVVWAALLEVIVLSIELAEFKAILEGTNVTLNWITASETNNDYFTIERSFDGKNWEALEQIQGAGNSSSPIYYSTIDINPYEGISYYRIKQTDFDGSSTFSDYRMVQNLLRTKVNVYPNPTTSKLNITGNHINKMVLRDSFGSILIRKEGSGTINLSNLSQGYYFLQIEKQLEIINRLIIKN